VCDVGVDDSTNGPQTINWKKIVSGCISYLTPRSEGPMSHSCNATFALGSGTEAGRVWVYDNKNHNVSEILVNIVMDSKYA
jgi:hypothetical protein